MELCPCGSEKAFSECCEPALSGTKPAVSAEQLMRARYSAYATTNVDFIMSSTHPDKRKDCDEKAIRKWSEGSQWHGLEIVGTSTGGPADFEGHVEFVANFTEERVKKHLHEKAVFKKVDGQWMYYDGEIQPSKPFVRTEVRVSRNDPCPCGSGKKYKKCCS